MLTCVSHGLRDRDPQDARDPRRLGRTETGAGMALFNLRGEFALLLKPTYPDWIPRACPYCVRPFDEWKELAGG